MYIDIMVDVVHSFIDFITFSYRYNVDDICRTILMIIYCYVNIMGLFIVTIGSYIVKIIVRYLKINYLY